MRRPRLPAPCVRAQPNTVMLLGDAKVISDGLKSRIAEAVGA